MSPEPPAAPPWDALADLPPLDIAAVSRALAQVWRDAMDCVMEVNGLPRYQVPFRELAGVHEQIVELLRQYDEVRTRHLKFLVAELVRMHDMVVQPILMPREELEP